ncbi:MAG: hypothetical protein H0V66_11550 [Bdellovibrionales bacterium]|nr:hypothetical protein [Bdellovibrionales bacterium]
MKKTLFLITIALASQAFATSGSEEAKKSLRALIAPILQKSVKDPKQLLKDFSVEKCEKYKINWMNVILMKEEAALTYTFKPGCDIEGTVYPKIIKPFTSDLKLKNLQDFTRLQSDNKITATLEAQPVMNLAVRSARLTGSKGVVKFDADYDVRINPMDKENPVAENLGGEIRITEIYGKAVSIKEKIKVE